jgi:hypothetical protein
LRWPSVWQRAPRSLICKLRKRCAGTNILGSQRTRATHSSLAIERRAQGVKQRKPNISAIPPPHAHMRRRFRSGMYRSTSSGMPTPIGNDDPAAFIGYVANEMAAPQEWEHL